MTHVLVVADTHIRRGSSRTLPPAVYEHATHADVILHAGDVLVGEVLADLARFAPVHAVLGNNDPELTRHLPETLQLELDGLTVAMVHDSGQRKGRARRLARWFPEADVVVFGHSHIPVNEAGVSRQWLLNPGSPTERRRQPHHTVATFWATDGQLLEPHIHVVSRPS
ncbi:MAG: metallophosphoesterase [Actinobacteria bacterium QS_8_72_14]|nr:MAG: metallophosphoesterase [Actinobacteria bacterium QS_8_72_14]